MTTARAFVGRSVLSTSFAAALATTSALARAQQGCDLFANHEASPGVELGEMVAIDVDLDGDLDLAGTGPSFTTGSLYVRTNLGGGRFGADVLVPGFTGAYGVAVGDMDGDGHADLVVTVVPPGAERVAVLRATNAGLVPLGTLPVAGSPRHVALADFDQDGDLDVAVALATGTSIPFYANDGASNLSFAVAVNTGVGIDDVRAADFDHDGRPDVLRRSVSSASTYQRLLNAGGWTFGAQSIPMPAGSLALVRAADLDGDGFAEAIFAKASSPPTLVVVTMTDLVFDLESFPLASLPTDLAIGDMDGDGDRDVVCSRGPTDTTVSVLRCQGTASYAFGPAIDVGSSPGALAVADLDGDGRDDVAAILRTSDALSVRLAGPAGDFADHPTLALDAEAFHVASGDVDGDGITDLVASVLGAIELRRGTGGGSFAAPVPTSSTLAGALHLADLDGDGDLDLLHGDPFVAVAERFENVGGSFAPAQTFASDFALESIATADVDGDGDLDVLAIDVGNFAVLSFENQGGALAAPVHLATVQRTQSLALADLDGDDDVDLVVGCRGTVNPNQVVVMRGQAGLAFAPPVAIATAAMFSSIEVAAADFDGDGDADVAWSDAAIALPGTRILRNDGAMSFTPTATFSGQLYAGKLLPALLDDDGAVDLCVVRTQLGLTVLRNDGSGAFAERGDLAAGPDPREAIASDVDGDGRTDIAIASGSFARIDVLPNLGGCDVGTSYCSGDGSATACPCGNAGGAGRGCDNSFATGGAKLSASGLAHVGDDSVRLDVAGVPPTATVLFLQSEAADAAGTPFGDGLLCLGNTGLRRLRTRTASGGTASLGEGIPGDPALSTVGHVPSSGGRVFYQAYYRNSAAFCTSATFNLSNGSSLVWAP